MSVQGDSPRILAMPTAPMKVEPVILEGQFVRLEPLSMDHHAALCGALLDDEIWRWLPARVRTPDEMRDFIQLVLKLRDAGEALPFATIYKLENRVVGTTRYLTIDRVNHGIEIGATIVGKNWQRMAVNTEAKYLMLRHAFEVLGCLRVQFQTDSLNTKSKNAILRLGAVQDGIFRNHKICWDGRIRHSVYFSITDEEWPRVKADLEVKLARPYSA
jgi:N-acetyltransferase